ncbi:MAG: amino acid adenylation domain-containing protein [Planctomycetes bacterium]|nr:amino acid adenylation domain-containing protein [Planctomycetota bacterium]
MTDEVQGWGKIAIVGRAGRFSGVRDVRQFWSMLADGRVAATRLTDEELLARGVSRKALADPNYVRSANVLPDLDRFDAGFFGFSPREAAILDPQHRHFLECAWEAFEDAGHVPQDFPGRVGVFAGCGMGAYFIFNLLSNPQLVEEVGLFLLRHTGNDKDFLPTRLSYLLNLTGPSVAIQTACSTGLVAVHSAVSSLLSMECDMAIAGGVTIELPHGVGYHYTPGEILSPDGYCRAFDDQSQGTVFGSGVGLVVLRRLQDAIADGDDIKAVIIGSAINNDGTSKAGYLAPSVDGQAAAAAEALTLSGVPAESVSYLEAHGTGTPIGDPIELTAMTQVYGGGKKQFCGIGSVKTNIGHLDTAAGAASLIKVVEALRREQIPPSLNYKTPNSRFDLRNSPFFVVDKARPWPRGSSPRRAGINSLGVGGTNAHAIVEEAPPRAPAVADGPWRILPFSARTRASLAGAKTKWKEFLAEESPAIADVAHTLRHGRRTFDERLAVVARNAADLRAAFDGKAPVLVHEGSAGTKPPEIVFLFPGAGGQHPGAGVDLLREQPAFAAAVEACFAAMPKDAPADLRAVMFERPFDDTDARDKLSRSTYAIPALFVLQYAWAKWWEAQGIRPALIFAHSVGEYAGAVIAGVMQLADALRIVAVRGRVIDDAPAGAMTTVPLPETKVRELIGDSLDVAALNAPEVSVVTGGLAAIEALESRLLGTEHECKRIRVASAGHSRLLDGQLERFRAAFAGVTFSAPKIPMVSSLRGDMGQGDDFVTADYWVRHLRNTVRFTQAASKVFEQADRLVLEMGPGQTLAPLVAMAKAAHPPRAIVSSAKKPTDKANDAAVALAAFGGLWTHGVEIDWTRVPVTGGRRVSLPTYAFEKQRHWIEPGRGAVTAAPEADDGKVELRRITDVAQWGEAVAWTETPAVASDPAKGTWLVFAQDDETSRAVLAELQHRGGKPVVVHSGSGFARDGERFVVRPDAPSDLEALFAALGTVPARIVSLWPLAERASRPATFDAAFVLARTLQTLDPDDGTRVVFAAAGCVAAGDAPVTDPEAALALGVVAVAPREIPGLEAALVDVGRDGDLRAIARHLVDEAAATGAVTPRVAWRGGRRFVPKRSHTPFEEPKAVPSRLRDRGVYVITGGMTGIGRELALFLAKACKARVAIVSRRAGPDTVLQAAIEAAGGEVAFFAADVADRAALEKALDAVRSRWHAIHGLFHAAGLVDDAPLAAKSLETAHRVLQPKVQGGANLAALLPEGSLDLFAVFSSTSVTIAPPGQTDYVAANAFVESLAGSRRDGLVIAWGVWRDIGMAERTYGSGAGGDGPHPLLGPRVDAGGEIAFTRRYDPATDWVMAEHQVAGHPVLPGTAYVELAAAAARVVAAGAPCEVHALSLAQPMIFVDDLSRLVTVRLKPAAHGLDLVVESRAGQGAPVVEHARARLVRTTEIAKDLPPSHTKTANVELAPSPRGGKPHQADRVKFGPRWHNVGELRTGAGVAEGRFALPAEFAGDLAAWSVHPALLDMAATVGLHLLADRGDRLVHAPISVDRIRLFAPLPREVTSRGVIVADTPGRLVAFDVVLRDAAGNLVAILERFAMRAVEAQALGGATSDARTGDVLLSHGIRAQEAATVFARVLDGKAAHVVVSTVPLDRVRLAMTEARPTAAKKAKADSGAAAVADPPQGPVETRIAAVWGELLGASAIGRDDDFFALGGHSLNAVRMLARVRKELGVDLPLAALFEGPTVRAIAAHVVGQKPELAAPAPVAAAAPAAATAAPVSNAPASRTIDTTEAQREIYAAILIDPDASRAYNLSYSFHFTGAVDRDAMALACGQLVARHDSLRCGFSPDGLSLVIRRDVPWSMAFVDLADLDATAREVRIAEEHKKLVETPFDLANGPMFRATLLRKGKDAFELVLGSHHVVTDGWSIGVLMRDLVALYAAARKKAAPKLPAPASIADFVAAEKAWREGPEAAGHRDFWLQKFADGAPAMDLPADHARPQVRTTRAKRVDDVLDPATESAVRGAAKALGSSLPNFVFAAFQVWLARATGNRDVVVGLPSSGQLSYDLDGVVGHCVNFLPIRSRVAAEGAFADLVRDVRNNLAQALDHQNYSYGSLVRDLRLRRDPSRIALVPVIFNIDNLTDINALRWEGVDAKFTMNPRPHEHFELFVNLLDEPGRVLLSWNHNADLYESTTIRGYADRFRKLLQGLAAAPETRIGEVGKLFSGGALRPASGTFDDPGAKGSQLVTDLFRRAAAKFGARTALRFGDETMDYATLDARSDALAALLAEKGVRSGDLVGISSRRALELIVAVLGALKAGAGYVPFDTTLPPDRLTFMAKDTSVKVLLGECTPVTDAGVPTVPFAGFPRDRRAAPAATITGESMCYVMFTSGTTGRPKGVVLPHRSVIRMLVDTDWLRLSPDTVTLHSSSFAFDTSIIDIFAALLHGGTVVIPPDGALSLHQLADAIQSHGVNTLWLTSGLFHAIADMRPNVFARVDQVIVGGDIVSPVQCEKVMNACPNVTVINGYGPTESNVTNSHVITRADIASGHALPIGRAIPGTQIWIVDDKLNPVEAGVQGELCISGRGLALGYFNRTELTAEKFVQAPWDPSLKIYRSGDLAMDPGDGVIRFFGRMDGQVKIRGFRIELGEVEAVLESHDAIRQAVVIAVVPPGQTDKVLGAYIVPEGQAPERRALDVWLKERLPDYARPLLYKSLTSIPLNHNGKVDRRALPPFGSDDLATGDTAPEGPTETKVAAIWCALLGVKSVGAEANFFELGGHSLLAVRLFDSVHKQFGIEMPISTLFKNPTVRTLAATIETATTVPATTFRADEDWDTSVVINPGRVAPNAAGDHRVLFVVGGVGGNVNNLYELGQALAERRPLIGFQTRGILGHAPRATIEEMASEHIRYMRRHQPRGPYLLAGYSGGALTAYEMARQLTAAGEEVSELFIFDTFAPNFAKDFRPKVKQTLGQRMKSELDLLRDEGVGLLFERTAAFLSNKLMRGPVLKLAQRFRPERARTIEVERAWRTAAVRYMGGPYAGTVTLLQTEQRALRVRLAYELDPTLGWASLLAKGNLRRAHVPGDHLRMLHGQNVLAVVAVIEERLRELGSPPPTRVPAGARS